MKGGEKMSETVGILILSIFGITCISAVGIFTIRMMLKISNREK
jgi:hypothetical protein